MSGSKTIAVNNNIYEKQGFGARMGFGKKPALVIIDFINGFNDPEAFGGGNFQDSKVASSEGWDDESRVLSRNGPTGP